MRLYHIGELVKFVNIRECDEYETRIKIIDYDTFKVKSFDRNDAFVVLTSSKVEQKFDTKIYVMYVYKLMHIFDIANFINVELDLSNFDNLLPRDNTVEHYKLIPFYG